MAYTYVQAARHGGTQSVVNRIVIHCTVSPTRDYADNIANYFRTTTRAASAHYVVDQARIYQCLSERTVGYHAPPNTGSIGIELCDPQAGSSARWGDADHEAMLRLAAGLVREVAFRWKVPLRRLSVADLKAGRRGICGHVDVSNAWGLTDHGDPGSAFPWPHFMDLVAGAVPGGSSSTQEDPLLGLKKGDQGEAVQALQEMIKAAGQGKALGPSGSDGDYGNATAEALRLVRASVGSAAKAGYGDKVDAWAYSQLHAAIARHQARIAAL